MLRPGILLGCWWLLSLLANLCTKKVFLVAADPALLTFLQLSIGALLSWLYADWGLHDAWAIVTQDPMSVVSLSLLHALGNWTTNASLSMLSLSFTHVVKAGEPVIAVFLSHVYLKSHPRGSSIAAAFLVATGIALCSFEEASFNWTGLCLAMLSNVSFAARNAITKKISGRRVKAPSTAALFFCMSSGGAAFFTSLAINSIQKIRLLPSAALYSSVFHCLYNSFSLALLAQISLMSHAIGNVLKRGFIILFSAWYFAVPLNRLNFTGIILAVLGVALHSFSNHHHEDSTQRNSDEPVASSSRPSIIFWTVVLVAVLCFWRTTIVPPADVPILDISGCRENVVKGRYFGWIGTGNFGDELIWEIFLRQFARALEDATAKPVQLNVSSVAVENVEANDSFFIFGGGSMMQFLGNLEKTAEHVPVLLFGSALQDVDSRYFKHRLSPETLKLLRAEELSCDELVPHLPKNLHNEFRQGTLDRLRYGGVRGDLTHRIATCMNSNWSLPVILDPALLALDYFVADFSILDRLELRNCTSENPLALLNIRGATVPLELFEDLIANLTSHYRVLILYHQPNERSSALQLVAKAAHPCVTTHRKLLSIAEVLGVHHASALSIGARLHENIISAVVGTPWIGIAYAMKHYDFADSVGVGDFSLVDLLQAKPRAILDRIPLVNQISRLSRAAMRGYIGAARASYALQVSAFVQACVANWRAMGVNLNASSWVEVRTARSSTNRQGLLYIVLHSCPAGDT